MYILCRWLIDRPTPKLSKWQAQQSILIFVTHDVEINGKQWWYIGYSNCASTRKRKLWRKTSRSCAWHIIAHEDGAVMVGSVPRFGVHWGKFRPLSTEFYWVVTGRDDVYRKLSTRSRGAVLPDDLQSFLEVFSERNCITQLTQRSDGGGEKRTRSIFWLYGMTKRPRAAKSKLLTLNVWRSL